MRTRREVVAVEREYAKIRMSEQRKATLRSSDDFLSPFLVAIAPRMESDVDGATVGFSIQLFGESFVS